MICVDEEVGKELVILNVLQCQRIVDSPRRYV